MQKSLMAGLLGALLVVPFAAQAEGSYVGVGVGQSEYRGIPTYGKLTETGVSLSYGVQMDKNFDIEGGYINFGKAKGAVTVAGDANKLSLESQAVYLAAIGKLSVAEGLTAYGKLGAAVAYTKANTTDTIAGVTTALSDSKTKLTPVIGVGLSYQFTKEISGLVDYTYFDKISDGSLKMSMWSLGLRYHF